jgi:hypothetical protein
MRMRKKKFARNSKRSKWCDNLEMLLDNNGSLLLCSVYNCNRFRECWRKAMPVFEFALEVLWFDCVSIGFLSFWWRRVRQSGNLLSNTECVIG